MLTQFDLATPKTVVKKIDSTTKLPSENRQISAVGSAVGSIRTIQEMPGEEGGASSAGGADGASQVVTPSP